MKKLALTISALIFLALTAGILWFVRGGDKESASRGVVAEVARTQKDAAVSTRDVVQEKMESVGESTDVQHIEEPAVGTQQDASQDDAAVGAAGIDTSDWKEYCNEEYGFCVKYPEGWEVKQSEFNKATHIIKGFYISSKGDGKHSQLEENKGVMVEMLFWSNTHDSMFFRDFSNDPDYKIIKNNKGAQFFIHKNATRIYNNILVSGSGTLCGHTKKNSPMAVEFNILPTQVSDELMLENHTFIFCRDKKYVPILKEIFHSIKITQ